MMPLQTDTHFKVIPVKKLFAKGKLYSQKLLVYCISFLFCCFLVKPILYSRCEGTGSSVLKFISLRLSCRVLGYMHTEVVHAAAMGPGWLGCSAVIPAGSFWWRPLCPSTAVDTAQEGTYAFRPVTWGQVRTDLPADHLRNAYFIKA